LHTDVNAIMIAVEGRHELLEAVFGDPRKRKNRGTATRDAPMSVRLKEFARTHNALFKQRNR